MKDHQVAQLVNELRDVAIKYHDKQCLRSVISSRVISALMNRDLHYYGNPLNTFECDLFMKGCQPKGWIKIDDHGGGD